MAGYPLSERGNKTCLQLAYKPYIDSLAHKSILGRAQTVPAGYPAGSDVANLSVMGYDRAVLYRAFSVRSRFHRHSLKGYRRNAALQSCYPFRARAVRRKNHARLLFGRNFHRGSARTHLLFEKRVRQTALYAVCGHFVSALSGNRPRQNGGNVYPSARYFR